MRFQITLYLSILWTFSLHTQTIGFVQQSLANVSNLRDVKIADMDMDGDPDILYATSSKLAWIENMDGKGNFAPIVHDIGTVFNANVVFAADVDHNGTMDVLAGAGTTSTNSEVALFKNLDTLGTSYSAKITLTTLGDEVRDLLAADFDGDTDLDIVYASLDTDQVLWLENTDGQGTYGAPVAIYSNANGVRFLDVADADGDQDLDIFSSSYLSVVSGQFSWYKNTDGLGTFSQLKINDLDGNNATGIAVGDLNGDGAPDLVGCMYNSARVYWYRNLDSMGTFSSRITVTTGINGPFTVNIADLEGDGDNDLVVASEKDSKIGYLLNDGAGGFNPVVFFPAILNFTNGMFNASRLTATADMDADGDADIVAISPGNSQVVFFRNVPPLIYSSQLEHLLCYDDGTGAIYLTVSGGTPPYTITWTDSLLQGDTLTGLPAGDYGVTISDINGSMYIQTFTLLQPDSLEIFTSSSPTPVGVPYGTAVVSAIGGTAPYQYLWGTGSTTDSLINLLPGIYPLTVTDVNGCTGLDAVEVAALPALAISPSYSHPSCFGFSDGTIEISVTGGIMPYSISWDNPNLTGFAHTGLPEGDYSYTVSDLTGVSHSDTINLMAPPLLELSLGSTPATVGNNDGTALVTVSGGTPPYQYLWTGGGTTPMIDSLSTGLYFITITDAGACLATDSIFVDLTIGSTMPDGPALVRIYPNPVQDKVYIELADRTLLVDRLEIRDLTGKLVYRDSGAGLSTTGYVLLPVGADGLLTITLYLNSGAMLHQKLIRTIR